MNTTTKMSENIDQLPQPDAHNEDEKRKLTCHLVSLPKVVLTRVDELSSEQIKFLTPTKSSIAAAKSPVPEKSTMPAKSPKPTKSPLLSKSSTKVKTVSTKPAKSPLPAKLSLLTTKPSAKTILKRSELKNKKTALLSKPPKKEVIPGVKRPRGRPKKEVILSKQKLAHLKQNEKSKNVIVKNGKEMKLVPHSVTKQKDSGVKKMLKKTMLQKKSKVVIPPAKKLKLVSKKVIKQVPLKTKKFPNPIKVDKPTVESIKSDSGDDFLYDELIETLKSRTKARRERLGIEKANINITLKSNVGNKPPTIVKGGIIKKANLPPDLKPITETGVFNGSSLAIKTNDKGLSTSKKTKRRNSGESPVPPKKPSPWPISMSSNKSSLDSSRALNENQKKQVPKSVSNVVNLISNDYHPVEELKKPKFGPKQPNKLTPFVESFNDGNLSDEYTEEETLENDYELDDILVNGVDEIREPNPQSPITVDPKIDPVPKIVSTNSLKDDEDPHLDLLRILTDDSEESVPIMRPESKDIDVQTDPVDFKDGNEDKSFTNKTSDNCKNDSKSSGVANEGEPPVRTIYDLMNEYSLQNPSWNLHIIPETNAFCIAQVTKGRLGLPTLKKCIELDADTYSAKVYIHQYHIKRFDGVYDSEETILSLIEELNTIKA